MGQWLYTTMTNLGIEWVTSCISSESEADVHGAVTRTTLHPLGKQTMAGQELDLPPAVCGTLGNDPTRPTVLLYGHYDV